MKADKLRFYFAVAVIGLIDSALLASPNFFGKIGLILYKYHYLRTFPRTIVTVGVVLIIAVLLSELVQYVMVRNKIKKSIALILLSIFFVVCGVMLIKTIIDFTSWTYSHTGLRFRMGAYLLPILLMSIFLYGAWKSWKYKKQLDHPPSPHKIPIENQPDL